MIRFKYPVLSGDSKDLEQVFEDFRQVVGVDLWPNICLRPVVVKKLHSPTTTLLGVNPKQFPM